MVIKSNNPPNLVLFENLETEVTLASVGTASADNITFRIAATTTDPNVIRADRYDVTTTRKLCRFILNNLIIITWSQPAIQVESGKPEHI